jgi:hypothetical protein
MDLASINLVVGILSAVMMMIAIVYILTYMLGSFSSRSGAMSLRFVVLSLLYFFGTTVFLFLGVEWLTDLARLRTQEGLPFYLNISASALALNAVMHIFCGLLAASLYVKGQISQGLSLQRVLDGIRKRIRSKPKQ